MRYSIRTVTPLSDIPALFDLAEAKAHLRVDAADESEDALIEAQVAAACDHVERFTSQVLTERELELATDGFPCLPELVTIPRTPVTAIGSVKYTDPSSGTEVTLAPAGYRWSESEPDLLRPAWQAAWPSAAAEQGSVRLRFTAGYEARLAPASLVAAVKLMLGHLFVNREAVVTGPNATELPLAVQQLCMPYRRIVI